MFGWYVIGEVIQFGLKLVAGGFGAPATDGLDLEEWPQQKERKEARLKQKVD